MKRIEAKQEFCMSCGLCEVYCVTAHSKSKDVVRAHKYETPRAVARVKVERDGAISFALQCRNCDRALCTEACMTGAMHREIETGLIVHDEDRCVGCYMCVMACPAGAIAIDHEKGKAVAKCDLCAEIGEPACVANCPNGALVYAEVVEIETAGAPKKRGK
jgi:anaerobic carbon-monoxide dehydrogenase iron sulfur subunit